MKKLVLVLLLTLAVGAIAQDAAAPAVQPGPPAIAATNVVEKGMAPSYSDVYCAGVITKNDIPNSNYVLSGAESPNTARFAKNDSIFLAGSGWQEGQKLSLVRRLKDPNFLTIYKGQGKEVKNAGEIFADLGQATVTFVHGNVAVAHIDFSCEAVVPGDLVIPFQERAIPASRPRPYAFPQFQNSKNTAQGRIILAKDFDVYLGEGKTFFINIGSNQGLKVGDYVRVSRGYDPQLQDPADQASLYATLYEDAQKKQPPFDAKRMKEIPNRGLGEAIILITTPTSATAMMTFSIADIHIGDLVEVEPPAETAANQ